MRQLKVLSYNIQVGIDSHRFGHYVTRSWRHLFPSKQRQNNLYGVSKILKDYDLVALQEVDGGSLRSGFINQVQYLGDIGQFNAWYHQCNRNLGKIAQQSNGLLSRLPVNSIINHKLPGRIPGRGAIEAIFGDGPFHLAVYVVHLSLGKKARAQQLDYLATLFENHPFVIVLGDMNMLPEELKHWTQLHDLQIAGEKELVNTYPSWQPTTHIDHVLLSNNLNVTQTEVLPFRYSDHLPIAVTIELPETLSEVLYPHPLPGSPAKEKSLQE